MERDDLRLVAELVVPADPSLLTVCRTVLVGVVFSLQLTDQVLDDLKLVLSEVCADAMERTAPAGSIEIAFRCSDTEIEVSVGDRVGGIPAEGHGLGHVLLRRLCSRLDFGPREDGPGTVTRFAQTL
jgi:anti-sigma regulatory factor (Ser/Thr protein kinase)